MLTAWDLLRHSADRLPQELAIVDDRSERSLRYRELVGETERLAAGFAAQGIGPGDRVATVLASTYEHALAILALHRLGAVPALMNPRLEPATLAELAARGGMRGAVIGAIPGLIEALHAALPPGAPLWLADSAGGASGGGAIAFSECRGDAGALPAWRRPGREAEAFVFYTSGTSGVPKGVVLSQRTTEHRVLWLATQAGLRYGAGHRTLGFMPLCHAIGFYGVFLAMLAYGGTYHVMSAFDPLRANEQIATRRISYLFGVPTLLHALVEAPGYDPSQMASLELVLFGGGPIAPELLAHLDQAWPARLVHIYGTTEMMCSLFNPEPAGQPTRLRPGFYSRVRVAPIDGSGTEWVDAGSEGELIVDFDVDTAFSGYLGQPAATAAKLTDGWYRTGDVCRRRADGDLELLGRLDDLIRTGGESVHPEAVEAVLCQHPGVTDVAVFGVDDARWGQIVTAAIVGGASASDLDAHCRSSELAGFRWPKAYYRVDAIPRNAAGKVLRRVLRERAEAARRRGEAAFEETPRG